MLLLFIGVGLAAMSICRDLGRSIEAKLVGLEVLDTKACTE